nr:hypothetical protein Iba_chr14aCG0740 [Ipomoea batatas]
MNPSSWLRIWRHKVPCMSKLLTPPSRFSVTLSFSSTVKVTGSVGGRLAGLDWPILGLTSSTITSPSAFSDSKNWLVFCDFPSCIPRPFGGAVADADGRPNHLVENESISAGNPNPLPKPPPVLDMLVSLPKPESILPEPIDCRDIKPPFSPPLFFSILLLSISLALRFMTSLVSLILLCKTILCNLSS